MRVLVLSRYEDLGSSSRLRFYQYLPHLASRGITIVVKPLFGNDYVTGLYRGRIPFFSVLRSYLSRLWTMVQFSRFDVVWVEKELLPWIPAWLESCLYHRNIPLVVDYDDAVFHRYDLHRSALVRTLLSHKIDAVMRQANLVIVGNEYLAERARQADAPCVRIVPTVVDCSRYAVSPPDVDRPVTIGWIGSPSTAGYLKALAPVFQKLIDSHGVRIVAVGANPSQFTDVPVVTRPWSEDTEAEEIRNFDIGIMPLPDEPFERGKCGYKLIQYMACGKPVVASPVGVNSVIVQNCRNGYLATTESEWHDVLRLLCDDPDLRQRLGRSGRILVENSYSLAVMAPKLEHLLSSVVKIHV